MRRGLALVLATVVLLPGVALGHGKEDEALEKMPARALAQQALAMLSQENKAVEAHERIEAALKSKDREGVDLALLRRTQAAFDRGDHVAATRLIGEALTPTEDGGAAEADMGAGDQDDEDPGAVDVSPEALDHSPEFEPDRGTAEWVGAALGAAALLLGGVLLLRLRRRPA